MLQGTSALFVYIIMCCPCSRRHAILLLANNGVPTEVFIDKQEAMVSAPTGCGTCLPLRPLTACLRVPARQVLLLNGMTEDCRAAAALLPRLGGVDCLAMLLHMLEAQYRSVLWQWPSCAAVCAAGANPDACHPTAPSTSRC